MRALMRRAAIVAGAAVVLLGPAVGSASAAQGTVAGTWLTGGRDGFASVWSTAREVPGIAALNTGGSAAVDSVSCASAGNCSAGGSYKDSSGHQQAFVVSQVHGAWGKAKEVPGTAALNQGGNAGVGSVSCASAGNCSAGGAYTDSAGHGQAFVIGKTKGTWGTAQEIPGTAALNQGGNAGIASVSCASAGNCSAAGAYKNKPGRHGHLRPFVVGETNGTWGTAQQVPGIAALAKGGPAEIFSVSCATVNHCAAGGFYAARRLFLQPFVVKET